jgi:putative hydrolase of the HAD superfamily
MSSILLPIRCVAVDFGGTLASRGDDKADGAAVATALARCTGCEVPDRFAEALDLAMAEAHSRDRVNLRQTLLTEIIRIAAERTDCALPDEDLWSEHVFEHLPDARIDVAAAQAVRDLAERGVRLVLASNTRWSVVARHRTLIEAGLGDTFKALVLSTSIGVRKPHNDFYRTVLERAGCPAAEVLFVGDAMDKDVEPPRRFGMQSLLVAPVWASETQTGQSELPYFSDLPMLLEDAGR